MIVDLCVRDDGAETTVIIEELGPGISRWTSVFPSRADACWHIEQLGLLPPSTVDLIRCADLSELVKIPAYVRDPKTTLRGFPQTPMTLWH